MLILRAYFAQIEMPWLGHKPFTSQFKNLWVEKDTAAVMVFRIPRLIF
jgi:hypothetical protein